MILKPVIQKSQSVYGICKAIVEDVLKLSLLLGIMVACTTDALFQHSTWQIWRDGNIDCCLVLPANDQLASRLVGSTFSHYLQEFYNITVPIVPEETDKKGTYFVLGTPENNNTLAKLVKDGLQLTTQDLGDEGFQLVTYQNRKSKYIVAYANTPRALKYASQELIFYHLQATATTCSIEVNLNLVKKPQVQYRGIYMLPCWSAYDSYESWERVLRFNSELTLNRNWFWLDGFPIAGHGGEYVNAPLADSANVQHLLDFSTAEDMKIYIGGGWFTYHHEKAVGMDYNKGINYYLDYLKAFKNFHGFYFEPTGEGGETKNWFNEYTALAAIIKDVIKQRPDFEIAIAIGMFNNTEYLKLMSMMDPKNVFWWWCWGDPITDRAIELYPSVLRWHLSVETSEWHGSSEPPNIHEKKLAGIVTSYDPGYGYGNPWNGWGKMGVDEPRNFHPYTIPYFSHQYFYRERCWNLEITETGFITRLQRRLFDSDAPKDAAEHYWNLAQMTSKLAAKQFPSLDQLNSEQLFLESLNNKHIWSPRMKDTIRRMQEALKGLTQWTTDNY